MMKKGRDHLAGQLAKIMLILNKVGFNVKTALISFNGGIFTFISS